jgi:hypothetical protein
LIKEVNMEVFLMILQTIISIVIPVAISVLTYFAKKYVDEKVNNEQLKKAADIIATAVNSVQQTYVDDLKKNGDFTLEAQKKALEKAKNQALNLMNDKVTSAIQNNYGDIEKFVITTIEGIIGKQK